MAWIVVSIIRLVAPLLILVAPVAGSVVGILGDMTDIVWLDLLDATNISENYNQFDKLFDLYLYLVMGYAARRWKNKVARNVAWGLLGFRAMGTLVYEVVKQRWLLLVFPNVFVWFFLFQLVSVEVFKRDWVGKSYGRAAIIVVLLAIPKIYQEYLFHVVQIPLYQVLRPLVFFLN